MASNSPRAAAADKSPRAMAADKSPRATGKHKLDENNKEDSDSKKTKQPEAPLYTWNINFALDRKHEVKSLAAILALPPSALQGLADKADTVLGHLGVKTIGDLADWKFGKLARAIVDLKQSEDKDNRHPHTQMNFNKALDKKWETKSLHEICHAPLSAFQGLAQWVDELAAELHLHNVEALGNWKYLHWAQAIKQLAAYESDDHSSR